MKIIASKEMARLDAASPAAGEILMERAGEGLANFIEESFPLYPICFICGSGNNGGDGFVAARHLFNRGREVEVYSVKSRREIKGLPLSQAARLPVKLKELNIKELEFSLNRKKIVVDCILGTGFRPPLTEDIRQILEIINKKSKILISCDIPTGVNGDTGDADEYSIDADVTVTFAYPKIGHLLSPGSSFTGSLEVVDIGIGLSPDKYIEDIDFTVKQDCTAFFSRRKKESHKKSYGHILVVGGSLGLEGAVSMSASGAQRTGAGLVTCAVGNSVAQTVSATTISAMTLWLDENPAGYLQEVNAEKILDFIEARGIDCVVVGPGMAQGESQSKLCSILLDRVKCPVILDADGINNVANSTDIIKRREYPLVITPHPGEMARLTGLTNNELNEKRVDVAKEFANKYGCVVLLKGYRSVITDGKKVFINGSGNPGMATGGSGDVLSGIIASLVGEGMDILSSARIGAWVHGRAGDLAAWEKGQRFILPEDILESMVF
jgi:NAD(P)H-hydrate epimerase